MTTCQKRPKYLYSQTTDLYTTLPSSSTIMQRRGSGPRSCTDNCDCYSCGGSGYGSLSLVTVSNVTITTVGSIEA